MATEKVSVSFAQNILNYRCIAKLKSIASRGSFLEMYETTAHERFVVYMDKKHLDDLLTDQPKLWDLNHCFYVTARMGLDILDEEKKIWQSYSGLAANAKVDRPEDPSGWSSIYHACIPLRRHCLAKLKKAAREPGFDERYLALPPPNTVNEGLLRDLHREPTVFWNLPYCFSIAKKLDVDLAEQQALYQKWMAMVTEHGDSSLRLMVEVPEFNDALYY